MKQLQHWQDTVDSSRQVKQLIIQAKTNGQKEVVQMVRDFFVPDVNEPHIHVHDGGITFTDIGHSHKYLVRGDRNLDANIASLRQTLVARGDARSLKLNRWIKNHILH